MSTCGQIKLHGLVCFRERDMHLHVRLNLYQHDIQVFAVHVQSADVCEIDGGHEPRKLLVTQRCAAGTYTSAKGMPAITCCNSCCKLT